MAKDCVLNKSFNVFNEVSFHLCPDECEIIFSSFMLKEMEIIAPFTKNRKIIQLKGIVFVSV